MLSDLPETEHKKALADAGLNVPFGARCFLTKFLSEQHLDLVPNVLMHLMALGAF